MLSNDNTQNVKTVLLIFKLFLQLECKYRWSIIVDDQLITRAKFIILKNCSLTLNK